MTDSDEREALARRFLDGLYVCTRAHSAWSVGTMGLDDFHRADQDDEVVNDLVEMIYRRPTPATVETVEELRALDPEVSPWVVPVSGGEPWSVRDIQALRSDENILRFLPATVLTPATQPTASEPTEAQVEAAGQVLLSDLDGMNARMVREAVDLRIRAALVAAITNRETS